MSDKVLSLKSGQLIGSIFPEIELVDYIEDVDEDLRSLYGYIATNLIQLIKKHPDYKDIEIRALDVKNAPSKAVNISYRKGSITSRPIEWKIPDINYCSCCGVAIAGAKYFVVDSIRFCPFCAKSYLSEADEVLDKMLEEVKTEYYNTYFIMNI